jgi:hypothetical protein
VGVLAADAPAGLSTIALADLHTVFREIAHLESVSRLTPKRDDLGVVNIGDVIKEVKAILNMKAGVVEDTLRTKYHKSIKLADWSTRFAEYHPRVEATLEASPKLVAEAITHIDKDIEKYYFARLDQLRRAGLVTTYQRGFLTRPIATDAQVIDLASFVEPSDRTLVVSAIIATEVARARRAWQSALVIDDPKKKDDRSPTFIVIDEAHHLIPRGEGLSKAALALREQLRTIAGEGRKFGLFLLLVSQRVDKLDDIVLSECANKALLKHDSPSRLEETKTQLGLGEEARELIDYLANKPRKGPVLLTGPWGMTDGEDANSQRLIYFAARRTALDTGSPVGKPGGEKLEAPDPPSDGTRNPSPCEESCELTGSINVERRELLERLAIEVLRNLQFAGNRFSSKNFSGILSTFPAAPRASLRVRHSSTPFTLAPSFHDCHLPSIVRR